MLRILPAVAIAITSISAHAISVTDFQYETLQNVKYNPSEYAPYEVDQKLPKVSFNGFEVVSTPEYTEAKAYLDRQEYLDEYTSAVFNKVLFSTAYLVQNAESQEAIDSFASTSNFVDLCAYFDVDPEKVYVIETMLTKALKNDELKNRFVETHAHITQSTYEIFQKNIKKTIPYCSSFVGLDTIPDGLPN